MPGPAAKYLKLSGYHMGRYLALRLALRLAQVRIPRDETQTLPLVTLYGCHICLGMRFSIKRRTSSTLETDGHQLPLFSIGSKPTQDHRSLVSRSQILGLLSMF